MPHSSVHALPRRLVVATGNLGKLREFRSLLEGILVQGRAYDPVSLAELEFPSPEETGNTFLANALLKARQAHAASGDAALADDSGLEVDALGGAPGIHSARYAGAAQSTDQSLDDANNAKLQLELAGVLFEKRAARYRCALVLIDSRFAAPLIAEATWEGFILDAPRGANGFGYDPYFWLPDQQLTAAQLRPVDKNRLSHRGKAMRMLREALSVGVPASS